MNIRPMDLQVIIPHATDVAKVANATDRQTVLQQQEFAEQWKQIAEQRQQQVQTLKKVDSGKVSNENLQKENQQNQGQRQGREGKDSSQEADTLDAVKQLTVAGDPIRGRTIDIKT